MSEQAGSYAFGKFDQKQKELDRLKYQAGAAQRIETDILTGAGLKAGMKVLDLACGPGIVACLLANMAAPGEVLGVDLDQELLDHAKETADKQGINNIRFEQHNVYKLDLPDDEYDFVYARFLFQHLEHPDEAMAEIQRVLKPGGIVCIADVDDDWLMLYPEPKHFCTLLDRAARHQAKRGGDRFIGRKLGALLDHQQFQNILVKVNTFTSQDFGMKSFLDITTGFKHGQLAEEEREISQPERENVYQLLEHNHALGFAAVFVATGIK